VQKRAYKVEGWEDAEDLLTQIAKKTGKLLKGGDADLNTAAKMVLLDWQRGRLAYYSTPPGYSAEAPKSREALAHQVDAPANAVPVRCRTPDSCTSLTDS
jgi:nuclear GTP-binding protein